MMNLFVTVSFKKRQKVYCFVPRYGKKNQKIKSAMYYGCFENNCVKFFSANMEEKIFNQNRLISKCLSLSIDRLILGKLYNRFRYEFLPNRILFPLLIRDHHLGRIVLIGDRKSEDQDDEKNRSEETMVMIM